MFCILLFTKKTVNKRAKANNLLISAQQNYTSNYVKTRISLNRETHVK